MHGKKRVKTTEEIAKQKKQEELKKIEVYCKLVENAMELYKSNSLTEDGLKASAKVLDLNPEFYTLWNYRRKIFTHIQEQGDTEQLQSKLAAELKFIEGGIRNHPKSYWLFHHRQWVTSHQTAPNWQFELILTSEMLKADERNFHCWGYRRYITNKAGTLDTAEFQFTTKKIEENFSNYSAWHQRSKLIPLLYPNADQLQPVLEEEFELIQNAFYTEPKDSSAWFYYRWLIGQLDKLPKEAGHQILQKELNRLTEFQTFLAESESGPDALVMQKWPLQTRTVIMMKLGGYEKEIAENLRVLVKSDPDRRNYYIDMAQTLLASQLVEEVSKLVQELKVC